MKGNQKLSNNIKNIVILWSVSAIKNLEIFNTHAPAVGIFPRREPIRLAWFQTALERLESALAKRRMFVLIENRE